MADSGKIALWIVLGVIAVFLLGRAGIINIPSLTPAAPVAPTGPTIVTPSPTINPYITTAELLVDTKDPVAFASDLSTVQPNVTIKYFREGTTQGTVVSHVGGAKTTLSVNPGENIRIVWYKDSADKVYMGETSVVAPQAKKQQEVVLETKLVGSVAADARWNNVGGATQYTLAAGQRDSTKLSLEVSSNSQRKSFLGPKILVAYDKDAFDDIQLGASSGGVFGEYAKLSVPDRLKAPVVAGGEYYQKMYDMNLASLDDFGIAPITQVVLDAKSAVTFSEANEIVTFTIVDTAGYFGKDGSTIYKDVETAQLETISEIGASAADVSLTLTNTV